ncbi:hypothetical protein NQ317_001251 [Molorchus minor]|uniref:BTB domain-containing protein n=1 Tax=Molorchus minor TaxID=1323400 RepID=A0ABQ9ISD6_9CUCU|nr:hypothetical protein NQ317_001251 [Molorchus minor]
MAFDPPAISKTNRKIFIILKFQEIEIPYSFKIYLCITIKAPFKPPPLLKPDIHISSSSYTDHMRHLWLSRAHTDIVLIVGSIGFPAHRYVLAATSRAFFTGFTNGQRIRSSCIPMYQKCPAKGQTVVTLSKLVTPAAMQQCLQFAYTGTVDRSALNLRCCLQNIPFVAPDPPDENYENFLKRRLQDICLDQCLFADVIFELDDGACAAHKSMLTALL